MDRIEPALDFKTSDLPSDPVVFAVDGETFYCNSWIPGMMYLDYVRLMTKGGLISTGAVEDFFKVIMAPDEHKRFRKFVDDPDRRVDISLLGEIFWRLWERYSAGPGEQDRPTKPSSPSRSGRTKTAGGSKANSSSKASTPKD